MTNALGPAPTGAAAIWANPTSTLLSAATDANGYWWIDLAAARTMDLMAAFAYTLTDRLRLEVAGGGAGITFNSPRVGDARPFTMTLRSGATRSIPLGVGWNVIGLPIEPSEPLPVSQLARIVNGDGVTRLAEVFRFTITGWQGVMVTGTTAMGPADFALRPGEGYFLRMSSSLDWQLTGYLITGPISLPLEIGWNLAAVPLRPGLFAADLCQNAGLISGTTTSNLREAARWVYGGYQGHVCGYPFNSFPIVDTEAYFIRANAPGMLIPGTSGY